MGIRHTLSKYNPAELTKTDTSAAEGRAEDMPPSIGLQSRDPLYLVHRRKIARASPAYSTEISKTDPPRAPRVTINTVPYPSPSVFQVQRATTINSQARAP